MAHKQIELTATHVQEGRYPFKNLTERDRSYFRFIAGVIERHEGSATIDQIRASGELLVYRGSNKPDDAGVITRLLKAGLVKASADGRAVVLTDKGILLLENEEFKYDDKFDAAAARETDRQKRLGKIASRPGQREFSREIRRLYQNKCALTGCSTSVALEAAHIRTREGLDINEISNGILLRADIHALFDAGLITLTTDGGGAETCPKFTDASYRFLRNVRVFRPEQNPPSKANIADHRRRFAYAK